MKTFRTHFNVEESAELLRKRLGRRHSFNVHDAFTTVDNNRNGFITKEEFRSILEEAGIFVTEKDLCLILDRYDKQSKGRVTYSEFMEELLPKSPTK